MAFGDPDPGSASNPLEGLTAADYGDTGSSFNLGGLGSIGALGLGALGFGSILGKGEGPLPPQFTALEGMVPGMLQQGASVGALSPQFLANVGPLRDKATALENQGATFVGQGQEGLAMAERGQLTPQQQAQLDATRSAETNKSRQMFASMGTNPDQNTAALTDAAAIDARINVMSQQQIQSTIALALGQISSGTAMTQQGLGFESAAQGEESLGLNAAEAPLAFDSAAAQALTTAGQAQLSQDKNYSDSLTSAFSSIGKLFGLVGGDALKAFL